MTPRRTVRGDVDGSASRALRGTLWVVLAMLTGACAQILGFRGPPEHPFEHRAHVLRGISCLKCHEGVQRAGEAGPLHLPGRELCVSCHTDPHDARDCRTCHGLRQTAARATMDRQELRFEHRDHPSAREGQCPRCHTGVETAGTPLRARMGSCLSCHHHRDQFKTRDCGGCHVDLRDEGSRPETHMVHGADFLREHGVQAAAGADLCSTCHSERFCTSCHGKTVAALPSRLAFDQPMRAGVHRANFRARHSQEAALGPGTCTTCHTDRFCRDCHRRQKIAAAPDLARQSPHPAGWVGPPGSNRHGRAARQDPLSCASCHGGAGQTLCVGCHQVGGIGGSPHPPGWSSTKPRSELPCRLCHLGR